MEYFLHEYGVWVEYSSTVPQTFLVSPDAFLHARNKDAVAIRLADKVPSLVQRD